MYSKNTWTQNVTPLDATHMNHLETQYDSAVASLNQDVLSPLILFGCTATKDGSVASQLDLAAGVAYLKQSDNSLARISVAAQSFTTSSPSTTYYLDAQPDGTLSWGTAHSAQANYLSLCSVTTDSSANIGTVTDTRTLSTTFLSSMAGTLTLPTVGILKISAGTTLIQLASSQTSKVWQIQANTDGSIQFRDSTDGVTPLRLYSGGNMQIGNGSWTNSLNLQYNATNSYGQINTPGTGSANGIVLQSWNGTGSVTPLSIGGRFAGALAWVDNSGNFNGPSGGGIPTTRNGTATSVPIYTGTTTPTGTIPTGAIWIDA